MRLKGMLTLLSVLYSLCLHAQTLPVDVYTSKNGLIADRITSITQDSKGFMWFGSFFGICRYDGSRFERMSLPPSQQNKYVTFLAPVKDRMYAGFLFGGGLAEYANGKMKAHFIDGNESTPGNEFISLYDNGDGSVLLSNSSHQVFEFRNGKFRHIYTLQKKPSAYPRSILKDRFNNIMLATDNGLYIIPFPYQSEKIIFENDHIFSLVNDARKKTWFNRAGKTGVRVHSCEGWQQDRLINLDTMVSDRRLTATPFSGNMGKGTWCIANDSTLLNVSLTHSRRYKIPLDFSTDISAIYSDRENNIWIANEPGIIKVSKFSSQSYHFGELAAGGGDLMLQKDQGLWVTNSKYLYLIADEKIQKKQPLFDTRDYYGMFHVDSQNYLWIGLWNEGIWRTKWKNGKLIDSKKFIQHEKEKIAVSTMAEASDGTIFLGGINGVFCIRKGEIVDHVKPRAVSGGPVFVSCMSLDEKNKILWLGDNAQGIAMLQYEKSAKGYSFSPAGYVTKKDGLKDTYIRSMMLDHKSNLWVGTRYGGIFEVQRNFNGLRVIDHNKAAGLSCTRVTDIEKQDTSAIWFASCDGIYQYSLATGKWIHYNTSDGLLNTEVYAVAVDQTKKVWALSSQGVTKLETETGETVVPPLVTIMTVNVLGRPDTNASFQSINHYSYNENSIGFSFAGASFTDERKIRYRYILEGYDQSWSESVSTNAVNYASLPPGKYTFKVMAANAANTWSAEAAAYRFRIIRPFYLSPVFYFACITIGLLIVYMIRMQRLRQNYKIEKLRLSIARDLHDDIGSNLGSINLLSQTASRRVVNHSSEEIIPLFEKISQSAENTLEAMDDIVWSINPEKDKAHDLLIRMREFAIPLLEAKNIKLRFESEVSGNAKIPMNLRRNLFLIFKEAIYNIIKHSAATQADIYIKIDGLNMVLQINDNGKGFCTEATGSRNGIRNLKSRSEAVEGNIDITSGNSGTKIHFSAPVR